MFSNSVLVVEDDPSLGPLIQRVLSINGFRAICATSAAEALHLWQEAEQQLPVALVDLTLPGGMSGEVLVRRLKSDKPSLTKPGHHEWLASLSC